MSTSTDKPRGIRFLLGIENIFIPGSFLVLFITLACMTGVYWRRVHQHPELYQPPYSPDIPPGTLTPFIITLIGVTFFLITIFTPHSKKWWIISTITRLALSAGLIASTILQSHYLPLPLGSCRNEDIWRDPHVPDGIPTIFEVLPVERGHNKYGKAYTNRPCQTLVVIWRFEIAMAVLTALLALSAAFLAIDAAKDDSGVRHTPAIFQWLGTPFQAAKEYVGGLVGRFRRRRERKGAEAKLLVNDPESLEFNDHEMGIRVRPM